MFALYSSYIQLTFVLLFLSVTTDLWQANAYKSEWHTSYSQSGSGYSWHTSSVGKPAYIGSSRSSPKPPPPPAPASATPVANGSMAHIFLTEHNKVRAKYGAPALVWNHRLVAPAQQVTDTCVFKHTVNNDYGENIAAGQTSPAEVVTQWVDGPTEKSAYNPSAPVDSHFTQVVWEASRELGCAVTSCTKMGGVNLPQSPIKFWACEYNPPGNVETLYLKNVHALAGGAPSV